MMCRLLARKHAFFQGLLAMLLLVVVAATAIGQPTPYAPNPPPGVTPGADPASASIPQTAPAQIARRPPTYMPPAPILPPAAGAPPYSVQPPIAMQPPGYGPMVPPPQVNGPPPFLPNLRRFPPIPPAPYPARPVLPVPGRPALPDMVYVVTAKFWFRADALLWWTKSAPAPQPIVTTGSPTDAVPGAVGQPGTQVVFGGANYGFSYIGGVRFETGVWLDPGRVVGLEAGYFVLIPQEREFTDQSDFSGNPLIARPTINATSGKESAYLDSLPGQVAGGVDVKLRSEFQGANCDGALNVVQTQSVRLDGLLGFRYLSLSESLNVTDQFVDVLGGTRAFGGRPINYTDTLSDFDGFRTTNSFYGGSGGARLYYAQGRWYVTALGKVALGQVQQVATISGSSTLTDMNGHTTTLPGGILATSANMGRYYQHVFGVVPEGHLNLGYQITPLITVRVGYTFLYVNNVARPGSQMTRLTNPSLVPSDRAYSPSASSATAFQFHSSSYWAQGLNFGLDFRF